MTTATPSQDPIAALAARLALLEGDRDVRNVLSRYMTLCDQPCADTAFPQLGDLFTEDAVWEGVGALYTQSFGRQQGRAQIVAFLGRYLAPSTHFKTNVHFLTSDAVRPSAGGVSGQWVMLQTSTYADDSSELIAARLNIDFRQHDGRWQMAHFRTERLFCTPWNGQFAALAGLPASAVASAGAAQ